VRTIRMGTRTYLHDPYAQKLFLPEWFLRGEFRQKKCFVGRKYYYKYYMFGSDVKRKPVRKSKCLLWIVKWC